MSRFYGSLCTFSLYRAVRAPIGARALRLSLTSLMDDPALQPQSIASSVTRVCLLTAVNHVNLLKVIGRRCITCHSGLRPCCFTPPGDCDVYSNIY